ncbi:MAG TPA: hypothetical protein VHF27_02080 [Acidimicrobiales bacterium]|nr:hypothetical protein [Acidimicrobiales bacterium]
MIGIDGATVARPDGHPEPLPAPLLEALGGFEPEFFVEWQVADHAFLAPAIGIGGEVNSL